MSAPLHRARKARRLLAATAGVALLGSAGLWLAHSARTPERLTTGSEVVATPRPPAPPAPSGSEPRPRLALLSTSVADMPERSTATLHDPEVDRLEVMRPGERLARHPEVAVAAVGVRWVELSDAEGVWRLDLSTDDGRLGPGPGDLQRILGDPDLTQEERIQQLLEADAGERTMPNLLSEASFAPSRDENGELTGLLLTFVQPNGLYARLGLEAGDRLLEINGIRLDDSQAMEEVMAILETQSSLHLLVDSHGERRRLLVDLTPSRLTSAL